MATRKLQVFVSSTFVDLKEDRQAAVQAILKAGHIPAGMELFTAGDKSQWDTITQWIDQSDIYMLILGGRYGSIDPSTGVSYTEMEYDYAVSKKKPFFAVVITKEELERRVKQHGSEVLENTNPTKLSSFRDKVLSKISSFFSDSKDIRLAIHESIPDFTQKYDLKGWIPGAEVADTKPLIEEIGRLTNTLKLKESTITRLESENQKLIAKLKSEGDLEELHSLLDTVQVPTEGLIKHMEGTEEQRKNVPKEIPLLTLIKIFKKELLLGISNRKRDTGEIGTFLYFNVFPTMAMHDLAELKNIPGGFQRYVVSKKGQKFFAYLHRTSVPEPMNEAAKKK